MITEQHDFRATDHVDCASAWQFLTGLLPTEDLTRAALDAQFPVAVGSATELSSAPYDGMSRALHRRTARHLLLTGPKGVGKTTHLRELARRSATGGIPFLRRKRFLWLDTSNVGLEDSRGCLESIAAAAAERPDVVLCLDGLAPLLRRPMGGTNKPLLRAIAARKGLNIIGTLSRWEYNDLIGGDAEMLDLFTRIEIEEPSEETALEVARQAAHRLQREYGLALPDAVVQRAVSLASSYILNECHPAKALRVLQRVCEDADYERTQFGRTRPEATAEDVARVVSDLTGIPAETLAGEGADADFASALAAAVVGQDSAVSAAATELTLIPAADPASR